MVLALLHQKGEAGKTPPPCTSPGSRLSPGCSAPQQEAPERARWADHGVLDGSTQGRGAGALCAACSELRTGSDGGADSRSTVVQPPLTKQLLKAPHSQRDSASTSRTMRPHRKSARSRHLRRPDCCALSPPPAHASSSLPRALSAARQTTAMQRTALLASCLKRPAGPVAASNRRTHRTAWRPASARSAARIRARCCLAACLHRRQQTVHRRCVYGCTTSCRPHGPRAAIVAANRTLHSATWASNPRASRQGADAGQDKRSRHCVARKFSLHVGVARHAPTRGTVPHASPMPRRHWAQRVHCMLRCDGLG